MAYKVPEEFRITHEVATKLSRMYSVDPRNLKHWISDSRAGKQGFFMLPKRNKHNMFFLCLASNGMGWEHVSVSIPTEQRTPTWSEMCWVKENFWDDEDTVVQFHPPKSEYVNAHEYCLHLWKPIDTIIQIPNSLLVGPKQKI